jgi:hypothetical protein
MFRRSCVAAASREGRRNNQRKAIGEIISRAAVELHLCGILRAMTRKPSCLISRSHSLPRGRDHDPLITKAGPSFPRVLHDEIGQLRLS